MSERRRFSDFVDTVERYRKMRCEALNNFRESVEAAGPGAACKRVLFSKCESIMRDLTWQYDQMSKKELWEQCVGRCLRDASQDMLEEQLRKRLRESDRCFDEFFPETDIGDLDRKRLRKLSSSLGLVPCDKQDKDDIINAVEGFCRHRCLMRDKHALVRYCASEGCTAAQVVQKSSK